MPSVPPPAAAAPSSDTRLTPMQQIATTVVFNLLCYITIGLPLAVIPAFTHTVLGFDAVAAGLAVSAQYLATFASRPTAGRLVDTVGPKHAVLVGLAACAASGVLLVLAGFARGAPALSLVLLLASRLLLGCGESCVSTGCITWAIGQVGFSRAAQIISINGVAAYAGIASGAPLGLAIAGHHGVVPVGLLTCGLALAGLLGATAKRPVAATGGGQRVSFHRILRSVAAYGTALAMGSVGFGTLAAFITLFFEQQGWRHTGLAGPGTALSMFGIGFMLVRLFCANQINRRGGLPVSIVSLAVEVVGLLTLWQARSPGMAILGAGLTGAGFALVFPALGMLAVARVAPQSRGSAIGAYSVFLDIGLGISGPLLGLIAKGHGYAVLFLCAALASCFGLAICLWLHTQRGRLTSAPGVG